MPLVCLAKPSLLAPILGVNSPSCLSYGELPISPLALCRIPRRLDLEDQPEAVKAILMATAWNNIHGNARLSSKDGVGGIRLQAADNVVQRKPLRGNWGVVNIFCNTSTPFDLGTMILSADRLSRVVIVWAQNPNSLNYETEPGADLNIYIKDATGDRLTGSGFVNSWDNTYEILRFDPGLPNNTTAEYTLEVEMPRLHRFSYLLSMGVVPENLIRSLGPVTGPP